MGRVRRRQVPETHSRLGGIDVWLSRISNASQAALVTLGIYGYVHTVLPLYQKALLDEDIAQKTIELRKKEAETASLAQQIKVEADELRQLKAHVADEEKALRATKAALSGAMEAAGRAKEAEANAISRSQQKSLEAESQYIELRRVVVRSAAEQIHSCLLRIDSTRPPNSLMAVRRELLTECIGSHLATVGERLSPLRKEDADKYYEVARQALNDLQPQFQAYADALVRLDQALLEEDDAVQRSGKPRDNNKFWAKISAALAARQETYLKLLDQVVSRLQSEVGQ